MLNIGWVDFSGSDRDVVLSVLRQLTEPGAMDELGIGTIRNAFSDILFPGTSTIQTRAKYLFLIPYICLELERGTKLSPVKFIEALEQREIDLISVLNVNGADGIIGSRSQQTLKRKPSSIYWNALRTYGIFTEPLTIAEYAALIYSGRDAADLRKLSGRCKATEEDAGDDDDIGLTGVSFWRIPAPIEEWQTKSTIALTKTEAVFLREKIISAPKTRDSLLALILRENRRDFVEFALLEDVETLRDLMPQDMWNDFCLARDFSRFVHGAQLRYNVIYSEGQNEDAVALWQQYIEERPKVSLDGITARVKPHSSVIRFLRRFAASLDDTAALDELIISREKELKSPSRSKLTNKELYRYDGNLRINMDSLTFRLFYAQRLIRDIFEGVDSNA